jgi:alpha-ribazole phosphatase
MDIYLIRHTQTANNIGLCYGQTDVILADSYADEMASLHNKLPEFEDDCNVYSSPLMRCLQLAQTFSDNVIIDTRLLELNFGNWEGQPFDAIDSDIFQHWTDNIVTMRPPNGENFEDLYQRAAEFWKDLLATEAKQVLVFTHAGVIRALLAHALNLPLANSFQLRIDSGSVHKLQLYDNYLYVEYMNL